MELFRMNIRPAHSGLALRAAPAAALDYEIAQEMASALGRLGRALEVALAALRRFDETGTGRTDARAELVHNAGDALWCFMVQREACGMRDPAAILRAYKVPAEIYAGMGAARRR